MPASSARCSASEMHDFGNPLRLRRALDAGVRVVVAHCASMGQDRDLDRGAAGPLVDSFCCSFADGVIEEVREAPASATSRR